MEVLCGILLFLTGMIAGGIAMGLAQAKKAFATERLRQELENKRKDSEQDWDAPDITSCEQGYHEVKIYK